MMVAPSAAVGETVVVPVVMQPASASDGRHGNNPDRTAAARNTHTTPPKRPPLLS